MKLHGKGYLMGRCGSPQSMLVCRIGGKQDVFNDLTTVMALIPSNYSKSDGFPDYERIEAVSGRADRRDAGFWGSKVVDDYDHSLL